MFYQEWKHKNRIPIELERKTNLDSIEALQIN